MSDQLRWPRGTPVGPSGRGPGGGRFRATGAAAWAARAAARVVPRGHDRRLGLTRADLRGLHRSGLQAFRDNPISGGSVAQTQRRVYDNGQRVIIKRSNQEEAEVEYLASLVGEAIGAPVPAVIMTEPGEVWMGHAEGTDRQYDTGLMQAIRAGSDWLTEGWEQRWADTDPAWRLGLLDYLVSNSDRHPGNWMADPADDSLEIDPSSVVGIDHNRAWYSVLRGSPTTPQAGDPPPSFIYRGAHQAMTVALLDPDDYGRWRGDRLTEQEAEEIDLRLRSLRSEFRRLGREQLYDYTIGAWEAYLHGIRTSYPDPEEDAHVATPEQLADRIFAGERVLIQFDAQGVEDWEGYGMVIPGWHLATHATRMPQRGGMYEIQIEPQGMGDVLQWHVRAGAAVTYRIEPGSLL